MKPDPTDALLHTATSLMVEITPAVQPAYRQAGVTTMGAILLATREEFDRAAARRVEENVALRNLFEDSLAAVADEALAGRIREATAGRDDDFHVPALDETNQQLRALLIELQAHVEQQSGDDARAVEHAIWRELVDSTERRKLSLAPF